MDDGLLGTCTGVTGGENEALVPTSLAANMD